MQQNKDWLVVLTYWMAGYYIKKLHSRNMRRRKDDLIQEICKILLVPLLNSNCLISFNIYQSIGALLLHDFHFIFLLFAAYIYCRLFLYNIIEEIDFSWLFLLPLFFFLFFCMHFMSLLMQLSAFALAIEADILKNKNI